VSYLPYAVAGWLFFAGLYGIVTSRNLIHLTVCLTVMQSSTYVVLLAIGYRTGATAPIFKSNTTKTPAVDPVVQALTLTDVVVSVVIVALILALTLDVHRRAGTVDPEQIRELSG
jgi:multicomponent Na+:H+ antiporter subunit C